MSRLSHTTQGLLRRAAVLLLLLTFTLTAGHARPSAAQSSGFGQVDALVRQLMALYDVPGVAVGLIRDGQVVYTHGYGVRNTQTGQPVTENTIFPIGSVSKSFTALAIAQQVDAGTLNLDTPIVTYLPDFKLSDPAATRQLTLRHLLSHTSGVPPFDDWYARPATSRKQIVDDMATVPLTASPGQIWQYTNQNFAVAGYVLEHVTGQSWEAYTREHIFAPLGMTSANFTVTETETTADYASPHALDVLAGVRPIPFFRNLGPIGPAGSINANVLDLEKYALFQLGDGTVAGASPARLVSSALLDAMHTQQIAISQGAAIPDGSRGPSADQPPALADAPLPTNLGYGLGWMTETYHGVKLVTHNGVIDGFTAYMTLLPSARDGIILLTNAEVSNGGSLFTEAAGLELANWLLGVPSEPNLAATVNKQNAADPAQLKAHLQAARTYHADPAMLAALTGDYPSAVGTLTITSRDGKLYAGIKGQATASELVPFEPGGFLVNTFPVAGSLVRFATDAQGTITVTQDGRQIAQRLGPGVQPATYKDPAGRFTATIPHGLAVQPQGDLVTLSSATPPGTFLLTALDSAGQSLSDSVTQLLRTLDPTFDRQPAGSTVFPPVNGAVWTQYLYTLPGDQTLAVLATQHHGTTYFVLLQAKSANLDALTPTLQALVFSFQITQAPSAEPTATPAVPPGMPDTGHPLPAAALATTVLGLVGLAGLLLLVGGRLRRR